MACVRVAVLFGQHPVVVNGVIAEVLANHAGSFGEFSGGLRLVGQRPAIQFGGDRGRELLGYEPLHNIPLVVHDAVDAKVQVGAVELKQFAQQTLELGQVRRVTIGCRGHGANLCLEGVDCQPANAGIALVSP